MAVSASRFLTKVSILNVRLLDSFTGLFPELIYQTIVTVRLFASMVLQDTGIV